MTVISPGNQDQDITITPRDHSPAAYTILWKKETNTTPSTLPAAMVHHAGSFLTLRANFNANDKGTYTFRVFAGANEIYRGKAIAITATEPIKYSIYQ